MRYTVIDANGRHKGTQTLTDAMAARLEDRGYELLPAAEEPRMAWKPATAGRRG